MADYMTHHKSLQRLHKRGLIEISADRANYCAVEENPGHHNWEGPHGSSIFNDGFAFIYAPDDKADAFECWKIFDMLLKAIDYADKRTALCKPGAARPQIGFRRATRKVISSPDQGDVCSVSMPWFGRR
jgi:hypothetical protein